MGAGGRLEVGGVKRLWALEMALLEDRKSAPAIARGDWEEAKRGEERQ